MSLDFLSGLLLAAVVVFGLGLILKEWFGARLPTFGPRERRAEPPAGANAHLIGAIGRVVEAGGASGEMRVRIGMERWSARLRAPADAPLPVGTEVEVKAVDGLVVEVVEVRTRSAETAERSA